MAEAVLRVVLLWFAAVLVAGASPPGVPAEWSQPVQPFRIAGPVHYVGTKGIAVYLITTRDGLILLDGGLEENADLVERSIAQLGFDIADVKLIVATHAHYDHAAALSELKRESGADFASSPGDRTAYESGSPPSIVSYGLVRFPGVEVDDVLVDEQPITFGGERLTPVFTPGHTPGCTTWTMRVKELGRTLDVVFPCSMSVAGNKLVGNTGYPRIVEDFRSTFERMRQLEADVVLPSHPELADVLGRAERRDAGDPNAFIDPHGLMRLVDDAQAAFEKELKKEEGR